MHLWPFSQVFGTHLHVSLEAAILTRIPLQPWQCWQACTSHGTLLACTFIRIHMIQHDQVAPVASGPESMFSRQEAVLSCTSVERSHNPARLMLSHQALPLSTIHV